MEKEEVIRFYEGDVKENNDPLFSDSKAYVTWNALLFPTIETEIARSKENRKLNTAFIEQYEKVIEITLDLYKAMSKSKEDRVVYRVERIADYSEFLSEGMFTSFISTSTEGFLDAYQDKEGLVLLEIHIPKGTLYLDFAKELDSYLKEDEKEMLLAPYSVFTNVDLKMNASISSIQDRNGKPPIVYAKITLGKQKLETTIERQSFSNDVLEASKRFYTCLNEHKEFNLEDASKYIMFKTSLQNEIKKRMKEYADKR